MKKVILANCIILCSALFASCGKTPAPAAEVVESVSESVVEETPEPTETPTPLPDPTDTPTPEPTEEPTPEPEGTYTWEGTTVDDEDLYKKPHLTVENMTERFTSGPIELDLTGMQISTVIFHDADLAEYAHLDPEKEGTMVSLDFTAENTSDDEVYFDFYSTLLSNNKEQVHDSALGDYPDGTFMGNVVQKASLLYFLPTSTPETLEEITLIFDPPHSENVDGPLGEEIRITIHPADYEGL